MAKHQHKWSLVGPWYRHSSLGGGVAGRSARPILQKYAGSNFVNELLREPQRSLRFVGEDLVAPNYKLLEQPVAHDEPCVEGNPLKLYLDNHDRFYVVVCELHCQSPGFPTVARSKVMDAGFVVRKRIVRQQNVPSQNENAKKNNDTDAYQKTQRLQQQLHATEAKADKARLTKSLYKSVAEKQRQQLQEWQQAARQNELMDSLKGTLINHRRSLKFGWCDNHSMNPETEPSAPTVWNWLLVDDEQPQQLLEAHYPLYPLIPDPRDKQHSAANKNMWYGVVPTFSGDVDASGAPRFDDASVYEVRCYVRRHRECCKTPQRDGSCCSGELVWSATTEPYQVAPFFDLYGSGHKPINIKLPDINNLKQQVLKAPPGKGANVRMETPPGSGFSFKSGGPMGAPNSGSTSGGGAICFLAWPIFTFVAMFLFQLILPILLFLFQLWFLLSLRLCIPPSIKVDAGFAADLKLEGPEFNFEAKFSADFKLGGFGPIENYSDLKAAFAARFDTDHTLDSYMRDELLANIGRGENIQAIAQAVVNISTDYSDPLTEPSLPRASDGLYYFEREEPSV